MLVEKSQKDVPRTQAPPFGSGQLVTIMDGRAITSSLRMAQYFGIEHHVVMHAVESLLCSCKFREHNFIPSFYEKEAGIRHLVYCTTKDGFLLLVANLAGEADSSLMEEYVVAFNGVERSIDIEASEGRLLSGYIMDKIAKLNESNAKAQKSIAEKFGYSSCVLCDISACVAWNEGDDLKTNIDNLLAIFQNNAVAGWYALYRQLHYEGKYLCVLSFIQGFIDKAYGELKLLPS